MLEQFTTVNVGVGNQDEAVAFYAGKLGLEARQDVTLPEMHGFRWLTVGPAGDDGASLVLMTAPPQPVFSEETRDQIHALLGRGAWGGIAQTPISPRGVEFIEPPTERPHGMDADFRDP